MKKFLPLFFISFSFLFSGCATEKTATKEDLYRMSTDTSEEIISMKDDIMMLKDQNQELSQTIKQQEKQFAQLTSHIKTDLADLNTKIENTKAETGNKIKIILDTVNEENKRLSAKIHSLDKPESEEYETGYYHTVKKGDSLSKIAGKYNISLKEIMVSNEISDPNKIRIGQKIFVPEKKS